MGLKGGRFGDSLEGGGSSGQMVGRPEKEREGVGVSGLRLGQACPMGLRQPPTSQLEAVIHL